MRASTEKFVTVVGNNKLLLFRNVFLKALNFRVLKLDDPATMNANEMIVMGPLDHPFIILLTLSEVMFLNNFLLDEEIQSSINRGL